MIVEAIDKLVRSESLTDDEAAGSMEEIMDGVATPAQIGAFLIALRMKGETVDELTGLARIMRSRATPVELDDVEVVDTCGTGGDRSGTFNISTAAAIVAAAAGVHVAKHGNRAMSSRCGSADVLEALGVQINLDAEEVARCVRHVGIGFMFAPLFHPAMKYAAPVRRELGTRTVFNILGPLTNPAGARTQVLGVADPDLAPKMAGVLERLGSQHALVVHGHGGLDELSITGPSVIYRVCAGQPTERSEIRPGDLGLEVAPLQEIIGGTAEENAVMVRAVLSGERGPKRDVVLLNAAAALFAARLVDTLREGVARASQAIDNGAASETLDKLAAFSRNPVLTGGPPEETMGTDEGAQPEPSTQPSVVAA
ncbi:MAG: anthranilate phosphoribosyltransferase [Chloroflexi bacterium]|nr:anthranilate phosphoribosyltransferase [Chloroflexota bacterium]